MTEEYYWDRRRYPSDLQDVEPGLQIQIKLQRSGHNSIKFVPHQHTLKKKSPTKQTKLFSFIPKTCFNPVHNYFNLPGIFFPFFMRDGMAKTSPFKNCT